MGKYTSIGGQALIEGIMMKSPEKTALAVRVPDGSIDITYLTQKSLRDKYKIFRLPIIRGVVSFIESMFQGYKAMMLSADKSGFTDLEEEKKAEKKASKEKADEAVTLEEETIIDDCDTTEKTDDKKEEKKKNEWLIGIVMVIGTVLGMALAVGLFMFLPSFLITGIEWVFKYDLPVVAETAIMQGLKLTIFVGYVFVVSFMKDIKRVFMYHGAEHKTIFCYEAGLPLTVENVKKQKRCHPRCGTSFMILMILVSFVISIIARIIFPEITEIWWVRGGIQILLIPITCGVGFEVLKFCGRYDNILTKIISAPGLWLQRITTKEPDDKMIEIAISALKACEPENPDVDRAIDNETEEEQNDDI